MEEPPPGAADYELTWSLNPASLTELPPIRA